MTDLDPLLDDLPPLEDVDAADDLPPLEDASVPDFAAEEIPPLEDVSLPSGVPDLEETATSGDQGQTTREQLEQLDLLKAAAARASQGGGSSSIPGLRSQSRRSRAEVKAKKAMLKAHHFRPVKDIARVTIKQNKMLFVFEDAEVFQASHHFYLIFGEAQILDLSVVKQQEIGRNILDEVKKVRAEMENDDGDGADDPDATLDEDALLGQVPVGQDTEDIDILDSDEDDEESDADSDISIGEVDEKDIGVVMDQANVSRKKAIKALKESGGDIVDAVMALQIE